MVELFVVLAVLLVTAITSVVVPLWALARHNRVHADSLAKPPFRWLFSPSTTAILHRRLRSSVSLVTSTARDDDPLAHSVIDHAVRLDADLVHLRRLRRADRRAHRSEARTRTRSVETAAYRVAQLNRPIQLPAGETLQELHARIDYVEQAHAEIDAMVANPARAIENRPS